MFLEFNHHLQTLRSINGDSYTSKTTDPYFM